MHISKIYQIMLALIILYIIICFSILYLKIQPLSNYLEIVGLLFHCISFPLFYYCIKENKANQKTPWILFLLSAILFFISKSESLYSIYFLDQNLKIPILWNFLLISSSVLYFLAFIFYIRIFDKINLAKISIDMIITTLAILCFIYILFFEQIVQKELLSGIDVKLQLINKCISISLIISLLIIFFNAIDKQYFRVVHFYIISSFLLTLFGNFDIFCKEYNNLGLYHFLNQILLIAYLLIAIAGLYDLKCNSKKIGHRIGYVKFIWNGILINNRYLLLENILLIFPYLIIFVLLIFIGKKYSLFTLSYISVVILIFLVAVRQILIIIKNKTLLIKIGTNEKKLHLQNLELQKLNQQILNDSQHDFLTKLFNRRHIDEIFKKLTPDEGINKDMGLIIIDVDWFKMINDTYGHQVGDDVLKLIADKIRSCISTSDYPGRYGGDEFIIIMSNAKLSDVADMVNCLQNSIRNDKILNKWHVSLSIGGTSSCVSKDRYYPELFFKAADDALYEAKKSGRNCYKLKEFSL